MGIAIYPPRNWTYDLNDGCILWKGGRLDLTPHEAILFGLLDTKYPHKVPIRTILHAFYPESMVDALLVIGLAVASAYGRSIGASLKSAAAGLKECAAAIEKLRTDIWQDGGLKDLLESKIDASRHKLMKEELQPRFASVDIDINKLKRDMVAVKTKLLTRRESEIAENGER